MSYAEHGVGIRHSNLVGIEEGFGDLEPFNTKLVAVPIGKLVRYLRDVAGHFFFVGHVADL